MLADLLQSEADAHHRRFRFERPAERGERLPGGSRAARTRADAQSVSLGDEFRLEPRVVIPDDVDLRSERTEEMRQVVRKRIVVVDQQDARFVGAHLSRPKTSRTIWVLARISRYSACGSLSATIPAEACQ